MALGILNLLSWPYWWALAVLAAAALELSRAHLPDSIPNIADAGTLLMLFATATVPFACLGKVSAAVAAGSGLSALAAIITASAKVSAIIHGIRTCKPHAMVFIATVEALKLLHLLVLGTQAAAPAMAAVITAAKISSWPGWWATGILLAAAADSVLGLVWPAHLSMASAGGASPLVSRYHYATEQVRQACTSQLQSWLLTGAVASLPFTLIVQVTAALAYGSHTQSLLATAVAICKLAAVLGSLSSKGFLRSDNPGPVAVAAAPAAGGGNGGGPMQASSHYEACRQFWRPNIGLLTVASADFVYSVSSVI
jgi:hypothetical protein